MENNTTNPGTASVQPGCELHLAVNCGLCVMSLSSTEEGGKILLIPTNPSHVGPALNRTNPNPLVRELESLPTAGLNGYVLELCVWTGKDRQGLLVREKPMFWR